MKALLITLFLITAACGVSEPKTPCACQRNMHDCLYAYDGNKAEDIKIGWSKWEALCKQDLHVCRSNRGMQ